MFINNTIFILLPQRPRFHVVISSCFMHNSLRLYRYLVTADIDDVGLAFDLSCACAALIDAAGGFIVPAACAIAAGLA